jgi:hypothetical protein
VATVVRSRRYRGTPYWENEQGRTVQTDKVRVVLYQKAGKLQVSHAWRDRITGKVKYGRTAVLDAAVIGSSPEALALLEDFIKVAQFLLSIPRISEN